MPVYTPPPGRSVQLKFEGVYLPPDGRSATLNFLPPGSQDVTAAIAATTEDAAGLAAAIVSYPATIDAHADDAAALCLAQVFYPAAIAAIADDASAEVRVGAIHYAAIGAATEDGTGQVDALYDSNVWRGLITGRAGGWTQGIDRRLVNRQDWQVSTRIDHGVVVAVDPPDGLSALLQGGWESPGGLPMQAGAAWQGADGLRAGAADGWMLPPRQGRSATIDWAIADRTWRGAASSWDAPPHKKGGIVFHYDRPMPASVGLVADVSAARRHAMGHWIIPWGQATRLWIVRPPEPPVEPPTREWPATLVFLCRKPPWVDGRHTTLIFRLHGCPWPFIPFIPKQKVYFVENSVIIVRLPDMTELLATAITINADSDSWAWRFNADFKSLAQLALLLPDAAGNNREIRATINGHSWDFIVEQVSESRQFGDNGFTVSGRSLSAYFADPYAPVTSDTSTQDMTANQLAEVQLSNTDWAIDWQLQDWLIPAGIWSQVATPMAKILAIADAVDGMVLTDRQSHIIAMMRRYPVLPWEWDIATPFAQIPIDIMTSLAGNPSTKPEYNGVYLSGQSAGVTALVKRTGSAGDVLAPMRVHPLLTHIDANRMAGEAILAATGRIQMMQFTMPIEDLLGLIPVNQLLEINDNGDLWRGLTRSINVTAQWQGDKGLTVRQTIEVERHG